MNAAAPAGPAPRHLLRAWLLLTTSLAVHVADEAANDFLATFYNPNVLALRERWPWFPAPVFTFEGWITALIAAVVVLFLLAPLAARRAPAMAALGYVYGVVMLLNGLGHIAASFYYGRMVAGVYSAPLLLAASVYLLWALERGGGGARVVPS